MPDKHAFFALTGCSGSGKSTVAGLLQKKHGAIIIDADALAREAVLPGTKGLAAIVEAFGAQILLSDGSLDRKALSAVIFADPAQKQKLESILHPAIRNAFDQKLSLIPASNGSLIFYDIPLYFEVNYRHPQCKAVIVVSASLQTCIRRIMKRDGINQESAEARLRSQIPIEQKAAKADFVISNEDGDDLQGQIAKLVEFCKEKFLPSPSVKE